MAREQDFESRFLGWFFSIIGLGFIALMITCIYSLAQDAQKRALYVRTPLTNKFSAIVGPNESESHDYTYDSTTMTRGGLTGKMGETGVVVMSKVRVYQLKLGNKDGGGQCGLVVPDYTPELIQGQQMICDYQNLYYPPPAAQSAYQFWVECQPKLVEPDEIADKIDLVHKYN